MPNTTKGAIRREQINVSPAGVLQIEHELALLNSKGRNEGLRKERG